MWIPDGTSVNGQLSNWGWKHGYNTLKFNVDLKVTSTGSSINLGKFSVALDKEMSSEYMKWRWIILNREYYTDDAGQFIDEYFNKIPIVDDVWDMIKDNIMNYTRIPWPIYPNLMFWNTTPDVIIMHHWPQVILDIYSYLTSSNTRWGNISATAQRQMSIMINMYMKGQLTGESAKDLEALIPMMIKKAKKLDHGTKYYIPEETLGGWKPPFLGDDYSAGGDDEVIDQPDDTGGTQHGWSPPYNLP